MVRYGFHNTPALTAVQRGSSRCHSDSAAICNLATLFCQEEYNSHNPRKVSNLSCAGLRAALDDTTQHNDAEAFRLFSQSCSEDLPRQTDTQKAK